MNPPLRRTFSVRPSAVLCAVLALGFVAGCSSTAPRTPGVDPISRTAYPNITITPDLEGMLVAAEPEVVPATGLEPMAVRAPIRSVVRQPLFLEYRFVFYGPASRQLSMNPVWIPVEIPALQRRFISANAISREAVAWQLEIRRR